MPPNNGAILKKLEEHTRADETRFDRVEGKLANMSGKMYVLMGLVAASGFANFFAHSG